MSVNSYFESLPDDLRYALRGFRRNRTFTCAAVLALGLGCGAGTAVFSAVDRILFRSLPYADGDRLVSFGIVAPIVPQEFMLGYDYLDWRDAATPFSSMGSWMGVGDCDLTSSPPVRLHCAAADSRLLPTLGLQPFMGRNFTAAEDRAGGARVALISYGLWKSRYGSDAAVAGRAIPLDGRSATIVGVLPPQFELPALETPDVLVPQALDEADQRSRRTATLLFTVGRLKPGVSAGQAATGLQPLFQKALESVSPEFRHEVHLRVRSLRDRQTQDSQLASWILLAAVLAVLLIACANVANLLLARGAARERESAVRSALGAPRWRLVRQALTESVLLALLGGAVGAALAIALLRVFTAIAPEGIPRLSQASVDGRVLLFTLAVSLGCGVLAGLIPALHTPGAETLTGFRTLGSRQPLFRQGLLAAQICVSMILLAGASLLLRSLWNLETQPLGMRTGQVVTAGVNLGHNGYPDAARRLAFFEQWESRLARIPGVAHLALADSLPPSGSLMGSLLYSSIDVEGRPRSSDAAGGVALAREVTPQYFAALGIPMLQGRGLTEEDRGPDRHAVVLSDTLARRMFRGENPLGRKIRPARVGPWLTVVGVAGNVRNNGLVERDDPEYYAVRGHAAREVPASAFAILAGPVDPQALARSIRDETAALDPALPVEISTLDQRVGALAVRPRFNALLLGIFAAMGLLLSAIGLSGVVAFLVARRTPEIGVRMAMGASPSAIAGMILGPAARWTLAGAGAGLASSYFAVRLLQSMLYRVPARDPWTLATAVAVLCATALLAAWIPARRAARVDPVRALRQD